MLWEISPDDADKDAVTIRNTNGEIIAPGIMFETALELVNAHNRGIEEALRPKSYFYDFKGDDLGAILCERVRALQRKKTF